MMVVYASFGYKDCITNKFMSFDFVHKQLLENKAEQATLTLSWV